MGGKQLAKCKLLMIVVTAMIVAFLFQCVQFLTVEMTVGLSGLSYPLQSLSFFENSPYMLTIGQAYGIVLLCRVVGAAWFRCTDSISFRTVQENRTDYIFGDQCVASAPPVRGQLSQIYSTAPRWPACGYRVSVGNADRTTL